MKKIKNYLSPILLSLIFILGGILRLYDINQNYSFYSEVGDNLLDIKNAYVHHYIPLLGPPTSHPWLYFGPLFYWIYGPILILFKFDPLSHSYFGAYISLLTILFNYYFMRKMFGEKVALFSSFFIAISPMYMIGARVSRFIYFVPLLIYPFLYTLYKIVNGKKYFFLLTLFLGIMLNFHYTPLILIPFIITIFWIKKVVLQKMDYIQMALGFILPLSPLLLYDSKHQFLMVKNLVLWFPYKILVFLHIYSKTSEVIQVPLETNYSFVRFFSESFIPHDYSQFYLLGIVIFLIIVFFVAWQLLRFYTKREKIEFTWLLILSWGFWGLLSIFIHGTPPLHYFVPLFPLPIIIFSLLLEKVFTTITKKILVICFLLLILIINIPYYFSDRWFVTTSNPLSYANKQTVARFIIKDAKGKNFILHRKGYNDSFPKEFDEDYEYLLWWLGNQPVQKASLVYTIYEPGSSIPTKLSSNEQVFEPVKNFNVLKTTK